MAKELLVGKNGNKKTTDFYTWKNGTEYRVLKGYVWQNGTPYIFYDRSGGGYSGFKWVFDYPYEVGQTYTKNLYSILDTVDYLIEKNVQLTYTSSGATLMQAVQSKKQDIINYISNNLISTDDTVYLQGTPTFSSSYAGGSRYQLNVYVGQSNLSSVTISSDRIEYYPIKDLDNSAENNSRLSMRIYVYGNGTMETAIMTWTKKLSSFVGQHVYYPSITPSFNYVREITNVGGHPVSFSSGNVIANFDYRQSYYDTVDQVDGFIYRNYSTRDSQGLYKNINDQNMALPMWILHYGNAVEVSLGTTNYNTSSSNTPVLIQFNGTSTELVSLVYRSNKWNIASANYYFDIGVSNFNYFDNSTVKMSYSKSDGTVSVYKDNALVYQSFLTYGPTSQSSYIQVVANMEGLVKTLRVISE